MLLRVENLAVEIAGPAHAFRPVDGVSFELDRGQTLALVGESGAGKSLTGLSILQLLPPAARIAAGRILFDGRDLAALAPSGLRTVRGGRIAIVFQEPMSSLNPLLTIGRQVAEVLELHRRIATRAARPIAIELLGRVGLAAPADAFDAYPHQMSGGMRQRVMIAMALAGAPDLLIADEPTTALDITIQAQILALLKDLQRERGMAMIFITHDLGVVAQVADVVCILYAGRIVEQAGVDALFATPLHPYTQALLRCTPSAAAATRDEAGRDGRRLPVIPGEAPSGALRPGGCAFHPRCALGRDDATCRAQSPGLSTIQGGHAVACWKAPGYSMPPASPLA